MKRGHAPVRPSNFSRWGLVVFAFAMAAAGSRPVLAGSVAPVLTKSFLPTTINVGGTTVLTFTVSNPAGVPALSNVGFVDTLPSGLVVANPPSVGGTCANAAAATIAGTTTVTVSNLQIPAGAAFCTVTVNVTNATGQTNSSCAGSPAAFTNTSLSVTVTNSTNAVQPSCVTVLAPTGTPTNTPVSTATTVPSPVAAVPALSPSMLALLALGLVGAGIFLARRS